MIASGRQLDRLFRKLDAEVVETGSHLRAYIRRAGERIYPAVLFSKSDGAPQPAAKKAILRSLGLREAQFEAIVSCRISSEEFFKLRGIEKAEDWKNKEITIPVLVDPFGTPIRRGTKLEQRLVLAAHDLHEDLIKIVRDRPSILFEISSREFEILINSLLQKAGFNTTLTHPVRDGGKDIIVANSGILGSFLFLVECKRYASSHTVGVDLVRELYGVVESERATAGMLVTTSNFTRGAKVFQKKVEYRLALKDYTDLIEWISGVA